MILALFCFPSGIGGEDAHGLTIKIYRQELANSNLIGLQFEPSTFRH
jgi:hypothetical protein